jgi:hypothetical protein
MKDMQKKEEQHHADGKAEESSLNNQSTRVVIQCNNGFGMNKIGL